jgi:TolB protein
MLLSLHTYEAGTLPHHGRKREMRRRAALLLTVVAALVLASGVALIVPKQQARAAFPGQEGKIAFVSKRHGSAEIYTMSSTGNNLRRLTNNSWPDYDPAWSAGGEKIVFWRQVRSKNIRDYDLYTMNADGSNKRLITDERSIAGPRKFDQSPAFSPNGRRIVFRRGVHIYVINTNGSGLSKLPTVFDLEYDPVWSPDGTKIAFTSQTGDVVVMDSDGSNPVQITEANDECFDPDWSPDGTRITCVYGDVFVMDSDGSNRIQLPGSTQFGMFGWESSAFSPSGNKIVFAAKRDGDFDIYTMNDDGSEVTQLTNDPAREWSPDWQPVQ